MDLESMAGVKLLGSLGQCAVRILPLSSVLLSMVTLIFGLANIDVHLVGQRFRIRKPNTRQA